MLNKEELFQIVTDILQANDGDREAASKELQDMADNDKDVLIGLANYGALITQALAESAVSIHH